MTKLLTIIIPSYNMENYIENCCRSLLVSFERQKQLEVLIINDGSKDATSSLAHAFVEKYPDTFKVIDKENGNYGSCINIGLKHATGIYVKVLDADDSFFTENFEEYIAFLETAEADLILSDFVAVDSNGMCISETHYDFIPKERMDIAQLPTTIVSNFRMHAVAYKTKNIQRLGYVQSEGISYTDEEWIFYPMSAVSTYVYFNKPVYRYLVGRNGQTTDPQVHAKHMWMELMVTNKMIDAYYYHADTIPDKNRPYLDAKLISRCHVMYAFFLVVYRKENRTAAAEEACISFDKKLQETFPVIYEKLNAYTYCKVFRFIAAWRKTYDFNALSLRLCRLIERIR